MTKKQTSTQGPGTGRVENSPQQPLITQSTPVLHRMPSTQVPAIMGQLIAAGPNWERVGKGKRRINPNYIAGQQELFPPDMEELQELKALAAHSKLRATYKSEHYDLTLQISDAERLIKGQSRHAQILFVYIMIQFCKQTTVIDPTGKLSNYLLSFTPSSMTNDGVTSTNKEADRVIEGGIDIVGGLAFKGIFKQKGHHEPIEQKTIRPLFKEVTYTKAGHGKKGSQCVIVLNERVNWAMFTAFFTLFPGTMLKLRSRPLSLALLIFFRARQRTQDIKEKGHFIITYRDIQEWLTIPSEIGNDNPDRTIWEPIWDAIDSVNDSTPAGQGFHIEQKNLKKGSTTEKLDKGYIRVKLSESYAAEFIKRATEQLHKEAANRKMKEKAKVKAIEAKSTTA